MTEHHHFIDLRVLLVHPDQAIYDLLQMALEEFRFDRITHVENIESARDQLCFNHFDLTILSSAVPASAIYDLIQSIQIGELGSANDMEILCLHSPSSMPNTTPEMPNLHFCPATDNSQTLSASLREVFSLTMKNRTKPAFKQGRAAHCHLQEEKA